MEEVLIQVKNLCMQSGKGFLLNQINWQVKKGEHWLIFGMNGSGKTTLLSAVAGFKPFTSGALEIMGQTYTNENILSLRRKIGWVSSSFFDQQYAKESVLDIVLSGKFGSLGLDTTLTDHDIKRAKALLSALHLTKQQRHPFQFLSKGERQNVLIARALIGNPRILMLDEPCTGLDMTAREQLLNTVADLASNSGITMVYVTHHTDEILTDVFKHTMLLKNGRIAKQGETEDIFNRETMSAFLGVPIEVTPGQIRGFATSVAIQSALSQFVKVEVSDDRFA